jgi:hypothetical protein
MRVRMSELLLAGALFELAAFALRVAVLLLGVAVWAAVMFSRWVLWPLLRLLGQEVANTARRVWGVPLSAQPLRTWHWRENRRLEECIPAVFSSPGTRRTRSRFAGLPSPASRG